MLWSIISIGFSLYGLYCINLWTIPTTGVYLLGSSFFFCLYWLWSVFLFLFKKERYGRFTTFAQRFWKRSFYLFWLLELFLFSFYIYLYFIAPSEVMYIFDERILLLPAYTFQSWQIFLSTSLVLIGLGCCLYLTHHFFLSLSFLIVVFILLTWVSLMEWAGLWMQYASLHSVTWNLMVGIEEPFPEGSFVMGAKDKHGNIIWAPIGTKFREIQEQQKNERRYFFDTTRLMWEFFEDRRTRYRTRLFVNFFLILLKVWHILFIYGAFIFLLKILLFIRRTSTTFLAFNLQNILFYFLFLLFAFLPYLHYYGTRILLPAYFTLFTHGNWTTWVILELCWEFLCTF